MSKDKKIDSLLNSLSDHRATLVKYVEDMETLKDSVSSMFPSTLDYRSRHVMEEKVKTLSSFYATLLNLNQEISKSTISEINARRQLDMKKEDSEMDIRSIVKVLSTGNPELAKLIEDNFKPSNEDSKEKK